MAKHRKPKPPPFPGYRTQVGIADVWNVDDPVKIPENLSPSVKCEDYVDHVRTQRKGEYLSNLFLRILVESVGLYQYCGNLECQRAGGCCSRRVECFEKHQNLLEATVMPAFRKALREGHERTAIADDVDSDTRDPLGDPRTHAARWRAMQAKRGAGSPSRRRRQSGPL